MPDDRGEQEQDAGGHVGERVHRRRLPELAAPCDRHPVDQARERGQRRRDQRDDQREPPRLGEGMVGDAELREHRSDQRERVSADRDVGQRWMEGVAGQATHEIAELEFGHTTESPPRDP